MSYIFFTGRNHIFGNCELRSVRVLNKFIMYLCTSATTRLSGLRWKNGDKYILFRYTFSALLHARTFEAYKKLLRFLRSFKTNLHQGRVKVMINILKNFVHL